MQVTQKILSDLVELVKGWEDIPVVFIPLDHSSSGFEEYVKSVLEFPAPAFLPVDIAVGLGVQLTAPQWVRVGRQCNVRHDWIDPGNAPIDQWMDDRTV